MEWEGEFKVPGKPQDVIVSFADVERMARCVPGASLEGRDADGSYLGSITVSFGPKRIVFKGKATAENDPASLTGALAGQGAADMRAARFKVRVTYRLRADPDAPAAQPLTIVALRSDADLQGVIADFARTGGNAVARVFMADFARRVTDEFTAGTAPQADASTPQTNAPAISAIGLIGNVVADVLMRTWARIARLWSGH